MLFRSEDAVLIGGNRILLDRERRPSAATNRVVVGIRPESFEDGEFAAPGLAQIEVRVEVLEELGADAFVFFDAGADAVVIEDALVDDAEEDTASLLADRSGTLFAARVDPRTKAHPGDTIRLAVDASRLYFFEPDTGEALLGRAPAAVA